MNAYEIARAEATRVVEAAYRKAVAAGELPLFLNQVLLRIRLQS